MNDKISIMTLKRTSFILYTTSRRTAHGYDYLEQKMCYECWKYREACCLTIFTSLIFCFQTFSHPRPYTLHNVLLYIYIQFSGHNSVWGGP